jgi:hypothetical protein
MAQRGVYGAAYYPPEEPLIGILDTFPTAREAIASAESSVEQGGGGAFAFSQSEGQPFVLLRKFGQLWPETDSFHPGDIIGPGYMKLTATGERVRLALFDIPTRRERRQRMRENAPSLPHSPDLKETPAAE